MTSYASSSSSSNSLPVPQPRRYRSGNIIEEPEHGTRGSSCDEDEVKGSDERWMDKEMREMIQDDELYLQAEEKRLSGVELGSVGSGENAGSSHQIAFSGLAATDGIDIEAISADRASHRDQTRRRVQTSLELVPVHSSLDEKDLSHATESEIPSPPKRSLPALLRTSWANRHDPSYVGFWHSLRIFIVGSPSSTSSSQQQPDPSDPDYVPPKYRWTPILSGLLQPFSILLEIPGLTEHWYVRTINNVPVVYQSNPVLLDVGLAISMACGIIANIALISRFLERRVFSSTIITIVGLTIHDVINIVAVTIFGVVHAVDDGFTYSEAFWLCVCSTAASMFTNATLIYDLVRTPDFKRSGSGLTPKQRNLVIITMMMLVYLALGALCFNFLVPHISFQNALYYTVVTIETIGFGDVTPSTIGAKIFLFFYAPVGILTLAVTVGTARDTIVESWNAAYRRRRHEMLKRHRIRKRQREEEAAKRAAIEKRLEEVGKPVWIATRGGGVRGGAKGKKLNVGALSDQDIEGVEREAMNNLAISRGESRGGEALMGMSHHGDEAGGSLEGGEEQKRSFDDLQRREDELNQQSLSSEEGYREIQERLAKEEKMENWIKFAFAMTLFLLFWLVGATVFCKTEDWSWFVAFYFCFVTFTTIGYGEVAPQTPAGRAFFIIWAIFGVATVTLLIAVLTEAYSRHYRNVVVVQTPAQVTAQAKEFEGMKDRYVEEGRSGRVFGEERSKTLSKEVSGGSTVTSSFKWTPRSLQRQRQRHIQVVEWTG
ncbi:hypothetical protein IAR55_005442 [Kwoniella newhampshirensis]|uniref:Potassium channel domain-containing protein n=1 Tax=Kwoniella newhampshirensis TaxID=1651941 RepID=A0AAW0YVM4_9TREE